MQPFLSGQIQPYAAYRQTCYRVLQVNKFIPIKKHLRNKIQLNFASDNLKVRLHLVLLLYIPEAEQRELYTGEWSGVCHPDHWKSNLQHSTFRETWRIQFVFLRHKVSIHVHEEVNESVALLYKTGSISDPVMWKPHERQRCLIRTISNLGKGQRIHRFFFFVCFHFLVG